MKSSISPSMMCADIYKMQEIIETFEKEGIEYLHIDIMDGAFVPNFTLGTDFCRELRKYTDIPLDMHLMIEDPEKKLGYFDIRKGDYVSVHAESTCHLQRALAQIRALGAKAMVAINPATSISTIEEITDDIDGILVMTVNPGFAGQKLVPRTLNKIRKIRDFLDNTDHANIEIEVDGNVSFENAKLMKEAGANIFVAGTSSIFSRDLTLKEGIDELRKIIM